MLYLQDLDECLSFGKIDTIILSLNVNVQTLALDVRLEKCKHCTPHVNFFLAETLSKYL